MSVLKRTKQIWTPFHPHPPISTEFTLLFQMFQVVSYLVNPSQHISDKTYIFQPCSDCEWHFILFWQLLTVSTNFNDFQHWDLISTILSIYISTHLNLYIFQFLHDLNVFQHFQVISTFLRKHIWTDFDLYLFQFEIFQLFSYSKIFFNVFHNSKSYFNMISILFQKWNVYFNIFQAYFNCYFNLFNIW